MQSKLFEHGNSIFVVAEAKVDNKKKLEGRELKLK